MKLNYLFLILKFSGARPKMPSVSVLRYIGLMPSIVKNLRLTVV